MTAEVVDDDDVARLERRNQDLLDVGQETLAVDRTIDHTRRVDAIMTEGGQEGQRPPAAMRGLGDEPLAPSRTAVGARHIGLGPGFVDEDQAGRIKPSLVLSPLRPPPSDVGTILLAGVQAFF